MSSIGKLVRKSQASLFWCMQGLPKAKREAIYTLYAFCRHLDNVIDGAMPASEKKELLEAWRNELENIYVKKVPATDIGRKIYKNCMRFKIAKEDFSEILNSALLDFPQPLMAPKLSVFERYCYGAAEIPAYLALSIIGGLSEADTRLFSHSFGRAMQLTTILRDIKDDALAGHLYLPAEFLQEAGIVDYEPLSVVTDKNLIAVREKLAGMAAADYERAYALLNKTNRKQTRSLRLILNTYKCYFDIMRRRGWEIISPKPQIKMADKLSIAYHSFLDK